ncbi:MAG: glycosyltransferase family 4 protein [Acidiferrobacterales bacterium]
MKIKFVSCWYRTSYGEYTDGLRSALERQFGSEIGVITSNCGCGDPAEIKGVFQNQRCEFLRFPHVHYYKSTNPVKYWLRTKASHLMYQERARRYLRLAGDADVLHFQQVLNAFGSAAAFGWLSLPARAARVITVHELDPHQLDLPESNLIYNRADRIFVHTADLRKKLVDLGVDSGRIDLVEHGIDIGPLPDGPRQGIIFYGGHTLHRGKGVDTLFQAMAQLKARLKENTPTLVIHGHYGDVTPEYGLQLAEETGITELVRWRNQIDAQETAEAYGKALLCVLPYTGSFAGWPAVNALTYGTPVIATRRAGLPEHLGEAAVWVPENDSQSLAEAILRLLTDERARQELVASGRTRAESLFGWDTIAAKTMASYKAALDHKRAGAGR